MCTYNVILTAFGDGLGDLVGILCLFGWILWLILSASGKLDDRNNTNP